ncbi:unnamed protein product [Prorocentrum cordatum]|uniref:Protein kinase domain-containing protein n=1 Tax=Prorocentrum cordatum TaxID=2364126 RepID=A0ABN9QGW3_9DINO|nr:unnamed protein product [Polarella glacialis]
MSGTRAGRLPPASSRSIVETYVTRMASQLPEGFAFATLVPWDSPHRPDRLVTPGAALAGHWDAGEIASLVSGCSSLLVPCTLETKYEKRMIQSLLKQIEPNSDLCVALLQLLEIPDGMNQEYVEVLMARHDVLLALGADVVILDPSDDQDRLRAELNQAETWLVENAQRAQCMVDEGADAKAQAVLEYHHELMWQSFPTAMMHAFPPINHNLVETATSVGDYLLMHRLSTVSGNVILARRSETEEVALKVYDKADYVTAWDVENINRELLFLRDELRHPHIVQCICVLHSFSRVYLALQVAGKKNLNQYLLNQPGYRLDLQDAVDCTAQIAGALAFCHSRDIVHRQVSLDHVVVDDQSETPFCRLVDFFAAMRCVGSTPLTTLCGDLPCIAPEMVLEASYVAKPADCWSLGIVFLEAVGGMGSTRQAVGWPDDAELELAVARIRNFFSCDGSHARALAVMGGVRSQTVLARLAGLLEPEPAVRAVASAQTRASNVYT